MVFETRCQLLEIGLSIPVYRCTGLRQIRSRVQTATPDPIFYHGAASYCAVLCTVESAATGVKNACSTWNTPQSRYCRRDRGGPFNKSKLSALITSNGSCSISSDTAFAGLPPILILASPVSCRCMPRPTAAPSPLDPEWTDPKTVQLSWPCVMRVLNAGTR